MEMISGVWQAGGFPLKRLVVSVFGAVLGVGAISPACAFEIDTDSSDIKTSFDNTIKYSAAWRTRGVNPNIADNSIGPQVNTNDGDINFKNGGGMISNRVDWLGEFDFRYKNDFGFRASAAAWYDSVYNNDNENPCFAGGALVNSISVPCNQFTQQTTKLHGRQAEWRDLFVYGNFAAGDANVNVKAGSFTQLYGETLFFGYNGIAGAQSPLDLIRALSVPNSQFKEVARPVEQLATQVQITPELSIGAYYQTQWKKNRIPAAGSYFSFADFADAGGESVILGPGATLYRGDDITPRNSGQGGAQVKFKVGDTDYGIYAAQFHDKMPQFYMRPGVNPIPGFIGDYVLVYGENIKTVGASASTVLGETNVAAELSYRNNMPLVANGVTVVLPGNTSANGSNDPAYPVGNTLHFNMSAISVLGASPLWEGASFIGELAYNQRLSISKNANQLDPLATKSAAAIQLVFQPEYFQVLPGLDIQVPIGIAYGISGRSSVAGVAALMPSEHGGNINISIKGEYQKVWQTSLNFTHFYGPSGSVIQYNTPVPELSYKNFFGDRDFISLSVQRTF